ncbi:hypothetical protein [Plantibacter sp. RU18]|uniref:hypothetical protein n=1 Tax=Plantibacter sp. RU18 TaxID=3158143 RepID=UPI003D36DA6C
MFDADQIAVIRDGQVHLLDATTGTTVTVLPGDGTTRVTTGSIGATSVLLAVSDTTITVWSSNDPVTWELPAGATVNTLGAGVVIRAADGRVSILTDGGLAPYASPRDGAAPLAVTTDGALQWASARGEILTASPAGTIAATTVLAPPTEGAKASRWLSGGPIAVVRWSLPDESTVLATHTTTDGAITGQMSLIGDTSTSLVRSSDRASAMYGRGLIDLATGALSVPDETFTASTALGDVYYGATGTTSAILRAGVLHPTPAAPTVIPVGVTGNGDLVATVSGVVAVYPNTSAKR